MKTTAGWWRFIAERAECQGIGLIFVTTLAERRVGCWGYLGYAGHVCLQRISDGIARRGGA